MKAKSVICAAALSISSTAIADDNSNLTVSVEDVRNTNGAIIILAYDNAEAFEKMSIKKATAITYIAADAGISTVTYHGLSSKKYAFAAMHDEDGDAVLEMDGDIPMEGYAFTAMGPSGLPTKFEDVAMQPSDDAISRLHLKYWR